MPAQVDGAGCDVDVHEVIHNSALDVILDSVHQVSPTHINDLYEGQLSKKKKEKKKTELNKMSTSYKYQLYQKHFERKMHRHPSDCTFFFFKLTTVHCFQKMIMGIILFFLRYM